MGRRGAVGAEEIGEAVKEDVQAALALLQGQTFADLRGNTKAIRAIRDALKTEMTPSVRRYGLWLRNLSVTWGLTPEERERIKEDRHRSAVRDIEREAEIGEARPRPRSMKRWVVWGGGCLLLKLISVGLPASPKNGLHRGVRRTARSSAENPINFNRRQRGGWLSSVLVDSGFGH